MAFLFGTCICLRKRRLVRKEFSHGVAKEMRSSELRLFDLTVLRSATNNFSDGNWLGQGGLGPVYKGKLQGGELVAVKRLSRGSAQRVAQLKNEVLLADKLQHRNLARLIGYCWEKKEKLLVYEYISKKSLDKFLFDPARKEQLGWAGCYKIIQGIGQGLLYLHEGSGFRIIHCNLKATDILLDRNMNPKISGFGFAKLLGVDETQGRAECIAGTCGYMAPEYVTQGIYSTKTDVFNYGILILEIMTGRRISSYQGFGSSSNFLSYVWEHWDKGMTLQVVDRNLFDRFQSQEVLKYIHIGLLCVQEDPAERPSISTIILMLSNSSVSLPAPSRPAYSGYSSSIAEALECDAAIHSNT